MTISTHGLSIGIERVNSHFFLTLKAVGTLTHDDYLIITPMIDSALAQVKKPEVDVLIDASELKGWELRAAWDDLKLGLKHNNEFRNIAIYGHEKWQAYMAKIGGWFVTGDVKYFDNLQSANEWINQT